MIGGAVQYTLPVLNNHISPYINFSGYDIEIDNTQINLNYSEYGLKLYFSDKAKGLYAGIGASSFKSSLAYKDVSLSGGLSGDGSVDLNIDTTILKLGIKTGGRIYLRLEMGYGLGDLPTQVTFVASENSNPSYTETTTEDIPDIPGISETGLIIGNIGFGLSF